MNQLEKVLKLIELNSVEIWIMSKSKTMSIGSTEGAHLVDVELCCIP